MAVDPFAVVNIGAILRTRVEAGKSLATPDMGTGGILKNTRARFNYRGVGQFPRLILMDTGGYPQQYR